MIRTIILLVLFSLQVLYTYANEPVFIQYTVQQGLPGNMVYDIYRDSKGMLWFGTDNGIARYNGTYFEKYSTHHGLSDNEIFFFKEDNERRIWMSTYNGELCFYKNGKIYNRETSAFLNTPLISTDTRFIALHSDSSISVAFLNSDFFLNIKGNDVKAISIEKLGLWDMQVVKKHHANLYEIITENKRILIDSNSKTINAVPSKNGRKYKVCFMQDSVYLYDKNGIYNQQEQEIHRFNHPIPGRVIRLYLNKNTLLAGTDSGLVIDDKVYLKGKAISSITQDINGDYWIGTLGSGVFKMSRDRNKYSVIRGAYSGVVKYVYSGKEAIIFSTSTNRLFKINRDVKLLTKGNEQLSNDVHYINDSFFYLYSGYHITKTPHSNTDRSGTRKYKMAYPADALKAMILNDSGGYFHFSNSIVYARIQDSEISFTKQLTRNYTRVFWMNKTNNNEVWFTTGRLFKIKDTAAISITRFGNISFQWFRFYGNAMVGATQNNRLIYVENIYNKHAPFYIIKDNCNWTISYKIDEQHILLGTNEQYRLLTRHPGKKGKNSFSVRVLDNEFLPQGAEYITCKNDTIYAFSNGNVYKVSKAALLTPARAPEITGVIFKTAKKQYAATERISISYAEARNILLNFDVLSFNSKQLYYQYLVCGEKGATWNNIAMPEINLYLSRFGNYKIKLRAITQSGISSKIYELDITVLKPFYYRWWFIISAATILIVIAILVIRYRILYLLHKKEKEHQLHLKIIKSEYKALNALMNPHFIFNSLTNIQGLINTGNKSSANLYLDLLSKLMRQNMQNLSKEIITLDEELQLIKQYLQLEKLRYNNSFEYYIELLTHNSSTTVYIPPLLIQPLIENALKHGLMPSNRADKQLWVRLNITEQDLIVEVEDNGVGFKTAQDTATTHSSFALKNIYSRVAQLNELHDDVITLDINSSNNSGTKITVSINILKLTPATNYRS